MRRHRTPGITRPAGSAEVMQRVSCRGSGSSLCSAATMKRQSAPLRQLPSLTCQPLPAGFPPRQRVRHSIRLVAPRASSTCGHPSSPAPNSRRAQSRLSLSPLAQATPARIPPRPSHRKVEDASSFHALFPGPLIQRVHYPLSSSRTHFIFTATGSPFVNTASRDQPPNAPVQPPRAPTKVKGLLVAVGCNRLFGAPPQDKAKSSPDQRHEPAHASLPARKPPRLLYGYF